MIIATTDRLILREATTDKNSPDPDFFLALLNEPAWHRFIYQHEMDSIEKITDYLESRVIPAYQTFGFGFWVVELKSTNQPVGMCGFIKRDTLEHVDLGFAFLEAFWGKGYAYEAAKASLSYASRHLSDPEVLAITLPENIRSCQLLERLGFNLDSTFSHPGSDEILSCYSIKNKTT